MNTKKEKKVVLTDIRFVLTILKVQTVVQIVVKAVVKSGVKTVVKSADINRIRQEKEKNKKKQVLLEHFEIIWGQYPHKKGKTKALEYYFQWIKGRKISGFTRKLTDEQMYRAVMRYKKECEEKKIETQFIKHGDTFFNKAILDYLEEQNE